MANSTAKPSATAYISASHFQRYQPDVTIQVADGTNLFEILFFEDNAQLHVSVPLTIPDTHVRALDALAAYLAPKFYNLA